MKVSGLPLRTKGLVLLGLGLVFWALVVGSSLTLIAPNRTVFDLAFGFGPYVREMLTHSRYGDCSYAVCDHASRMPLLVWVASGAGLIARQARYAAVIKDLVMAALTLSALGWIWRRVRGDQRVFWTWAGVGLILIVSLPVAKHAGQLGYEENLSLPLLFVLGAGLPLALSDRLGAGDRERLLIGALVFGVLLYLLKSSLLLVFGVVWAAAVLWGALKRSRPVLIAAALTLIAPLGWGVHNLTADGRFSVMTSWEGENLRRGWNPDTYAIYPQVAIDRVFDSRRILYPDGHIHPIEPKPNRIDFRSEWDWSDVDKAWATDWIKGHPRETAILFVHKAENYFLSVVKTPRQPDADPPAVRTSTKIEDASVSLWLVVGRLAALSLVGLCVWLFLKRPAWRAPVLAVGALAAAYSVPCLIGFNYERHITTGLVLLLGCLMALAPAAMEAIRADRQV